jgi:hypothetical protein
MARSSPVDNRNVLNTSDGSTSDNTDERVEQIRRQISRMRSPLHVESSFYNRIDTLREQFERKVAATESNGGMSPLHYAFYPDNFQFLTVNAGLLFTQEILEHLMETLRTWASSSLDASHVSTPQVRIFINSCRRKFLRDRVDARWHYMLSITRVGPREKGGFIKVLSEGFPTSARVDFRINRVASSRLGFNEFAIHSVNSPYAVESRVGSMNPLEAVVFLDGYLW